MKNNKNDPYKSNYVKAIKTYMLFIFVFNNMKIYTDSIKTKN